MYSDSEKIANFVNLTSKEVPSKLSASIYFLGCNLKCGYCYNLVKLEQNRETALTIDQLKLKLLGLVKQGQKGKMVPLVDYIVFSGGECTLYTKELNRLLSFAKSLGFKTCVYTNGFIWNKEIEWGLVDLVSVDFKTTKNYFLPSFKDLNQPNFKELNPQFYIHSLMATFEELEKRGIPFYVRTVLIHPYNTVEDIQFAIEKFSTFKNIQGWFITDCLFGENYDSSLNEKDNSWSKEDKQQIETLIQQASLPFPIEFIEP